MLTCDRKDDSFTQFTVKFNVNLTQCASWAMLISGHLETVKILISHYHATTRTLISLREQCKVHFTQRLSSKTSIPGQNRLEF